MFSDGIGKYLYGMHEVKWYGNYSMIHFTMLYHSSVVHGIVYPSGMSLHSIPCYGRVVR